MIEGILGFGIKHSIALDDPRGEEVLQYAIKYGVSRSTIYRAKREGTFINIIVNDEIIRRNELRNQGFMINPVIRYNQLF